jgi:sensor histidine kinase regulating citrate/malate metabolism
MRLRTQIFVAMVCLVCLQALLLLVAVEYRVRTGITEQMQQCGMTAARGFAGLSTNALVTYNFVTLEQHAERIAREPGVVYAIVHEREGRVAAYSGRGDLQGRSLTGPLDRRAVEAVEPFIQIYAAPAAPHCSGGVLEVAMPVLLPDTRGFQETLEKWGTVRLGFSLGRMDGDIQQARRTLLIVGAGATLLGSLAALFLARRLTLSLHHP